MWVRLDFTKSSEARADSRGETQSSCHFYQAFLLNFNSTVVCGLELEADQQSLAL